MATLDKQQVIARLEELARLLELDKANPFKVRAFRTAAKVIGALPEAIARDASPTRLSAERGIGPATAAAIVTLFQEGQLPILEELRTRYPASYRQIVALPGVGPKRARTLAEALGVTSLAELEYACHEGRLVALPGFGPRSVDKILAGIEQARQHSTRRRFDRALAEVAPALLALGSEPGVEQVELCGDLRRRLEIVDRVICVFVGDPQAAARRLADLGVVRLAGSPDVDQGPSDQGSPTGVAVDLPSGLRLELHGVKRASFAAASVVHTGSPGHLSALAARALDRGLRLTAQGLAGADRRPLVCADEAALYRHLELAWIPPELREGRGEIEAAASGSLPELIAYRSLTGSLHNHTNWSDGRNTLEEMIGAARSLGWSWMGISDHSESARYAGGLTAERVIQQRGLIAATQARNPDFQLLAGSEVDVRADGSLDYPVQLRADLDFVIASIHGRFDLDREQQTRRVLAAIADPTVACLGHLTGRILLGRAGCDLDVDAVVDACAAAGVAIELNGSPHRLELDWRHLARARQRGLKLFINPDAHRISDLDNVELGLGIARKGGLEPDDVINTRDIAGVRAFLADRRARAQTT